MLKLARGELFSLKEKDLSRAAPRPAPAPAPAPRPAPRPRGTSGVGGTTNDLVLLDVTPLSPVVDKDLGLAAAEVSATEKASKKKPGEPDIDIVIDSDGS